MNQENNVNDTYYKDRINICKKCDSYQTTIRICKECGCFMPAKALIKMAKCPLNNWKDEKRND